MREVWIMCGGPSAKEVLSVDGDIIAVNTDIKRYPNATHFITCDHSFVQRNFNLIKNFEGSTYFIAGIYGANIRDGKTISDNRWGISYDLSCFNVVIRAKRWSEIGLSFAEFSTGLNSGYCALQLAVILGYKTIHLVGVDLTSDNDQTHWHDESPFDIETTRECHGKFLEHWKNALTIYKPKDIDVISRSPISKLNEVIPYEPIKH